MDKKIHSVMMLILLLIGMLTLAFNIQPATAGGTIYIQADGSIDPPTAPISTLDNITYAFTDNIYDEIVVQRNNTVIDGKGYTLQGTGSGRGIDLSERTNVTVQNTHIKNFYYGIVLSSSSNSSIDGNNIANNQYGIYLGYSSNNSIGGNNITANDRGFKLYRSSNNSMVRNNITHNGKEGIWLWSSSNNDIYGNKIAANSWTGIYLYQSCNYNRVFGNNITRNNGNGMQLDTGSSNNSISGNTITENGIYIDESSNNTIVENNISNDDYGIWLQDSSENIICGNTIANNWYIGIWVMNASNSHLYHNNLMNNGWQIRDWSWDHPGIPPSINTWDDGYPSGGNYWSDYEERYPDATEIDGSGIWDTPYIIDEINQDNYPLMEPWVPAPSVPTTIDELKTKIEELGQQGEIDNQGIVKSLLAKLNVAQKLVDKGKIDEAKSILEEDFIPQVQNLSDIHITPEAADILIKSAEYIMSHL